MCARVGSAPSEGALVCVKGWVVPFRLRMMEDSEDSGTAEGLQAKANLHVRS